MRGDVDLYFVIDELESTDVGIAMRSRYSVEIPPSNVFATNRAWVRQSILLWEDQDASGQHSLFDHP